MMAHRLWLLICIEQCENARVIDLRLLRRVR
jgi:hypothetical protein